MKYIQHKIQIVLALVLLFIALGAQVASPSAAFACGSGTGSSKDQVLSGVDQTGTDCSGVGVNHVIAAAVTILSFVIGFAAIIMILISAFRYITSGGDSGRVSSAKSALIYALVGIAIAALAQFLVHFVLYNANSSL